MKDVDRGAQPEPFAELLAASKDGDPEALGELVAATYQQLRSISRAKLRGGGRQTGLETTVLVHEAFIKLSTGRAVQASDREHFLAIAARAMRQLVVDHARARAAQKRGAGEEALPLRTSIHLVPEADEQVVRLHDALGRLEAVDERLARLVEMRVFGGLTEQEAAQALDISVRTLQRDWRRAKGWLAVALKTTDLEGNGPSAT